MLETAIIIPTLNEAENLKILIPEIHKHMLGDYVVLIVDDNSNDGTDNVIEGMISTYPVRMLTRHGKRGLASAVIDGIHSVTAKNIIVMDADLSHPVDLLPRMRSLLSVYDLVVASRRVKGGGADNWPWKRRVISASAQMLARPLTRVKDNTSGFFGVHSDCLTGVPLEALGYKIGLEIFVKAKWYTCTEIPFIFKDRAHGESKLTKGVVKDYLRHLNRLYRWKLHI